jgi:hypothetical protein
MDKKLYIAADLGAESGRVILAEVSSDELGLQGIHRFSNGYVCQDDTLRWDSGLESLAFKYRFVEAGRLSGNLLSRMFTCLHRNQAGRHSRLV